MSPRLLIAEHSKLKGSKPSSALSATLVKVYCGALSCACAAESIAPSVRASPTTSANTTANRCSVDRRWYVSILLPSGVASLRSLPITELFPSYFTVGDSRHSSALVYTRRARSPDGQGQRFL